MGIEMEIGEMCWHIFAIIGGIKLACMLIPWLYWKLFCCVSLSNYKYGYVLITGATDGIGKALVKEFLRRGFKVIMVSRSLEKLENVRSAFLSQFPDSTIEVIAVDFSYSHRDSIVFFKDLFNNIREFPVSILVNNVGVADMRFLDKQPLESLESMIGVNTYPITMLNHMLIPVFLERYRSNKSRSLIINISSTVEESILPGNSVYSATKRYIAFLSEALRYEYGDIDIVTVKPGAVTTPMVISNHTESAPLKTNAEAYARALLGGLRTGVNHAHWKHKLFGWGLAFAPYLLTIMVIRIMLPSLIKKGLIH